MLEAYASVSLDAGVGFQFGTGASARISRTKLYQVIWRSRDSLTEEENGPDVRRHWGNCDLVVNRSKIVGPLQQSLLKGRPARGYESFCCVRE